MSDQEKIEQALGILGLLGMPVEQQNRRTAMCLLALLDLSGADAWGMASAPLMGVRDVLDFIRGRLGVPYAENTRETVRDESIKPLVAAGVLAQNPDAPGRAVNSPRTVYQVTPEALALLRTFDSPAWGAALAGYLAGHRTLAETYARRRQAQRVAVDWGEARVEISAGEHSQLIRQVLQEFRPRFAAGSAVVYVGDTGSKWGVCDESALARLGVAVSLHGQMPDVVLYLPEKQWVLLVECVTSSGPIDGRRYEELAALFAGCRAGLVFVTAFPDRRTMRRYLSVLAWETEVWVADAPDHLIHFNGERFLGPYSG